MLQGFLGQNREPPPPQIPSSSRPPGRRAAILGKLTTGAARGCAAALQKPEKVLGKTTPQFQLVFAYIIFQPTFIVCGGGRTFDKILMVQNI